MKSVPVKSREPATAGSLDETQAGKLHELTRKLRRRRILDESKFSDYLVVRPPAGGDADPDAQSPQLQEVAQIGLGGAQRKNARQILAGTTSTAGRVAPRIDVVRRQGNTLVIKANPSAVLAMRRDLPGLKVSSAAWLYPQYVRPMGDELASMAIQVAPHAKVKKFEVRLTDAQGQPVPRIKVKALVDWEGAHVAAESDTQGIAQLSIPVLYPRVEIIIVEPEHSHWPVFVAGFDRVAAPRQVVIGLRALVPDEFSLLSHYAPYDQEAGAGVRVGVIDSGIGPHRQLAVAGGACLVTDEDPADFLDNGIGHGTHVAGIIAARRPAEPGGVHGLAPACQLMSYRVCAKTGQRGRAKSSDVAAALDRAIADRCDLLNISLGSLEAMPEVPDLLERARDAGMAVFAATGNDGQPLLRYPARYSYTLAVGALGRDGSFPADCPEAFQESEIRRGKEFVAEFSNHGLGTDFIGPGVAVLSTFPGDRVAMMSGTSMSTPFCTGMAARLLSRQPNILNMAPGPERADAIIGLLSGRTRKVGWSPEYEGFGVLKDDEK